MVAVARHGRRRLGNSHFLIGRCRQPRPRWLLRSPHPGNSRRGYRSHDGDHHHRAAHLLGPNFVWMGVLARDGARRLPVGKHWGQRKGVWLWTPLVGVAISFAAEFCSRCPQIRRGRACGLSLPALPFTIRQLLRWHWLCTISVHSANTFVPPDSFCVGRAARRFSMFPPWPRRATNVRHAQKYVRWIFP